ncbi:hypothetical protein HDU80_009961 [Chytriomyces hyalinus]|nr:hypothetical protein HDU80_009961 [Chytriomyces hyalinus]
MPHCPAVKGESRPLWSIPISFPHTTKGKAPANSVLAYRVDLRAEQLATLITLAENSYSALGVKSPMDLKPTEEDVSLHYERTRVFFKSHILDESIAFEKLTTTSNPIVLKALCDATLSIIPDTLEAQSIPVYQSKAEKDLLLSRNEQFCLSNLHFQYPTTVEAIRPMLKYIAARFDPGNPIEFHSHICRSLHSSPVTLNTLCMLMWGSCQGSLLIQMEGRANVGLLSVYDDVKEPELNLRERTTLSKMCQVTPDECSIEVRNIDLSDTAIKHEDAEFNLTESSALVNVRKQARDLLVASFQSKTQS